MFDDLSDLDRCYMSNENLEARLEESWQQMLVDKAEIESLKGTVNSLEIRNCELLDVIKKITFVLEESIYHA